MLLEDDGSRFGMQLVDFVVLGGAAATKPST
jgi:hypothetical protein